MSLPLEESHGAPLLDSEILFQIQEMFSKASGLSVTTFDNFSLQICPSSNLNPLCKKLLSMRVTHPEAARKCLNAHFEPLKEALETGKSVRYSCWLGLEDTMIPLAVNGKTAGVVSAGQVPVGELDLKNFEAVRAYGLDPGELHDLGKAVEKISPERYEQWIKLLATVAQSVVRERFQQLEKKKESRRVSFVSELSRHVGDDLDRLLDFVAGALPEACDLEKCIIYLLDETTRELIASASNAYSAEDLIAFTFLVKKEEGAPAFESEMVVIPNAGSDARLSKQYAELGSVKTFLSVPLAVRGEPLGAIHFINSRASRHFTSEEIGFAQTLASEVALAVESTVLMEERRKRDEELKRFRQEVQGYFTQIGRAISSALNTESLLGIVADFSMRSVKADGCSVYLLEKGVLTRKLSIGQTFFAENVTDFYPSAHPEVLTGILNQRTFLRVPLKTQEEMIGFLDIHFGQEREYSREELDVLISFSAQAALSIKNIRLFEAEQGKAREIQAVYEAAKEISVPVELDAILSETSHQLCALASVNRCFIFLLDEQRKILLTAHVHGVSVEQREFFSALAIPLNFLEGDSWQRFRQGLPLVLKGEQLSMDTAPLKSLFTLFGTRSCLLVPLLSESRLMGLVYLDEALAAHHFIDAQVRSVMALSLHAAATIERAQLYRQLEDQNKQVQTLYQISTALSTSLNLNRILQMIIEKTGQLVHAERCSLFMWDDDQEGYVPVASHGMSEEFVKKAVAKLEDRFVALAGAKKRPIYSANVLLETDSPQLAKLFKKEGVGAVLAVPLVSKRKTLGVIALFADLGYQFKEKEIHLLENFASHAALSIENARLYNQNKQKVQELGILFDVGKRIAEHLNPQEVLRAMAEQLLGVMKIDGCSVMLAEKDRKALTIRVTRGIARKTDVHKKIKVGQGIAGRVAKTGQPLVLHDQGKDSGDLAFPRALREEGISTILTVPLATKEEVFGVVSLYTRERREYTPSELHLVETIASLGAVAFRNARTFEEHYHVAQLIQRSLLPDQVPSIRDLDFGFQYLPSEEISGDYYDFIHMRGKIGITVADVSGKGTGAAIFTTQGKYAWKAYALLENDPQKVLTQLNRLMVENTPPERFISMFYGVLDIKKREFVFSNAGHLPPILYSGEDKKCRQLSAPGLLLGVEEEAEFVKRSVVLSQGDILVFYTDGVTEARNDSREIFGMERLEEVLTENANHSAQVIANRILSTVRQFSRRRNMEDDITLVVVKLG